MEIAHLRILRELEERGSIAAVAAHRRVSASAISQQLSALQRESRVALTYRDGRRTALTPAGRALSDAAAEVEVALTRARETAESFQDNAERTVSVTAFQSAGLALFGPLLAAFSAADLRLNLADFDVAQGDFPSLSAERDVVIAHRLASSPPWPRWVRSRPLFFEPLDLALRSDHPLAGEDSIEPSLLQGAEWISVHEGFPLEQALSAIATASGEVPDVVHRINDFLVAAKAVAASDCVALLPRYTVGAALPPDVVLRPLAAHGIGRHIDCLVRPESFERRSVRRVVEEIERIAADLMVPV